MVLLIGYVDWREDEENAHILDALECVQTGRADIIPSIVCLLLLLILILIVEFDAEIDIEGNIMNQNIDRQRA